MEYKRFNDTIFLRLDPGDEVVTAIGDVAKKENILLAEVTGIGAINDFVVGAFDVTTKEYTSHSYKGAYEITSLVGNITTMNDEIYLHFHLTAGTEEGNVVGGHLNKAIIAATGEIIIRVVDGRIDRTYNDAVGLNVFKF